MYSLKILFLFLLAVPIFGDPITTPKPAVTTPSPKSNTTPSPTVSTICTRDDKRYCHSLDYTCSKNVTGTFCVCDSVATSIDVVEHRCQTNSVIGTLGHQIFRSLYDAATISSILGLLNLVLSILIAIKTFKPSRLSLPSFKKSR